MTEEREWERIGIQIIGHQKRLIAEVELLKKQN